ncbi:MAG: group II intron reverse transcriptase domain-containing protein, partial [Oscillospiraceae bacterium]|nr:group II intron reverse transcriptase domain-containing protein [Oscillospiraceae bacterium]
MSIIDKLSEKETWETFYQHKLKQGNINQKDADDLRQFIDSGAFLAIADRLKQEEPLSVPQKTLINKSKSGKKRAVYTFNREENYALKVISFLLRNYDFLFAPNLYSFRKNSGVKRAVEDVLRIKELNRRYVYKLDISNYFNSVDIGLLLPMLKNILADDGKLFRFFESMLTNPYANYEGKQIREPKGIMAGTPVSAFLANLYLRDLDHWFFTRKIPYLRYSDDILVFAKDEEHLTECIRVIRQYLCDRRLTIIQDKEIVSAPGEKWTFLGFS